MVSVASRYDAVFASDVHLSAAHPATTEAFLAFVDAAVVGRSGRFFILGDLFEYWVGDDDADDALAAHVAARLRAVADGGVSIAFMAGNRDFLVGDDFAASSGMTLLADPHRETIGGIDLLLSHGDALCTDDVEYQRFRAMVRDPAWQQGFCAKPLAERRMMVAGARRQSEAAKRDKAMAIMDVNDAAVQALLTAHAGTTLVHGHTHRPARHCHVVEAGDHERWVLTDWDADAGRGGGLVVVEGRLVVLAMDGSALPGPGSASTSA